MEPCTTENMHFQNKDVDIFCPAVDERMGTYILVTDGNISKNFLTADMLSCGL